MNAYTVLQEHHKTLKGLVKKIGETPPTAPERQDYLDQLLVELDIHFRIEDDLYYPALAAGAGSLVAVAHAEHRQVIDALSTLLHTPPAAPNYDDEWRTFATTLEAHADEEERDMIPFPPSVHVTDEQLADLGAKMAARIEALRNSTAHTLRVKGRKALLRAL
ncbi:MAG: hemerythrin domain-containing protein [Mycobacterium sp.]|uniref:hemerythrin domain-containing protein n=1 Tax=Mycobacterium sp. TaxID=1785 RepID=UPI00261CB3F7|nr:hemerythrin domain-containing protein [Mycobacterium sp.]MDI3313473.1 hemerythrin domain-containing protein [Mycobacterium sp.]